MSFVPPASTTPTAGAAGAGTGQSRPATTTFTPFTPASFSPSTFIPPAYTPAFAPTANTATTPATAGAGVLPFRPAATATTPFAPAPFVPFTPNAAAAGGGAAPFVPFNPTQFQFRPPVSTPATGVQAVASSPFGVAPSALPAAVAAPSPFAVQTPTAATAASATPFTPAAVAVAPTATPPPPTRQPLPRGGALAQSSAGLATVDLSTTAPNAGASAQSVSSVVYPAAPSSPSAYGLQQTVNGHHASSANVNSGAGAASAAVSGGGVPSTPNDDPTHAFTTEHFSCHAIPNSKDTATGTGLPFGLLLTPSVTLPSHVATVHDRTTTHPPIECSACGSVLNPYCALSTAVTDANGGGGGGPSWRCVMCRTVNSLALTNDDSFNVEHGLKVVDYLLATPPPGMKPTPAVPSNYATATGVTAASLAAAGASNSRLDQKHSTPTSTTSGGGGHHTSHGSGVWNASAVADVERVVGHDIDNIYPDTYLFVIDTNLTKQTVQGLRATISEVVKHLHGDSWIGLITLSNTVALYDLSKNGTIASANVISGEWSPTPDDLEYLNDGSATYGLGRVSVAADTLIECIEAIEASMLEKDERATTARAVGVAIEVALSILERQKREHVTKLQSSAAAAAAAVPVSPAEAKAAASATAAARQRRSILSRASSSGAVFDVSGGHIVLCVSGSADFGPGAANDQFDSPETTAARNYFDQCSIRAHRNATTVHAFGVGQSSFAVPATLRPLVSGCGGGVYIHTAYSDPLLLKDMIHALFRGNGVNGRLQVRTSSVIGISRIIGAVKHVSNSGDDSDPAAAGDDKQPHPNLNVLTFDVCGVRPDGCIALYYRVEDDIVADYVYFQFIFTYTNQQRQRVARVITRRLPTTGNFDTFIGSIDANVTGVLMAKRTVLLASKNNSEDVTEVINDLDEQVRDFAVRFGKKERVLNNRFVSYALPKPIDVLPRMLFHLRRGPLLGPILQHSDDIDCLRSTFCHSPLSDSLRLLTPNLVSFNRAGQFEELGLETLCCTSDRILLLDHHSHVLIWTGRDMTRAEYDPFRDACVARVTASTAARLPAPKILMFKEGSSQARWLLARLIPSHKDTAAEQVLAVPQLQSLSPADRQALTEKFLPTDELSYFQYYRSLFNK